MKLNFFKCFLNHFKRFLSFATKKNWVVKPLNIMVNYMAIEVRLVPPNASILDTSMDTVLATELAVVNHNLNFFFTLSRTVDF